MRIFKQLGLNRSFWALVHHSHAAKYVRLEGKYPVVQHMFRQDCQPVIGLVMNDPRSLRLLDALSRKISDDWFSGQNMSALQELIIDYIDAVFPRKGSTHFGQRLAICIEQCAGNEISKETVVTLAILATVEDISSLLAA